MPPKPLRQLPLKFRAGADAATIREDVSAVYLAPSGDLWLASDESTEVELLQWNAAGQFDRHRTFALSEYLDLPTGAGNEIDIEGLAFDGAYLWVVGSHSRRMKKPKSDHSDKKNIHRLSFDEVQTEPNRYLLARIPLADGHPQRSCPDPRHPGRQLTAAQHQGSAAGDSLLGVLRDDPHVGAYIRAGIPGKANGLDIEGLEAVGNRLFLGLRGPVLLDWAILLEIELMDSGERRLDLKDIGEDGQPYRKHFVNLNGLGVRDLCRVGDDLLILSGPTMYLDGPAKVFRLGGAAHLNDHTLHRPEYLFDLPYGDREDHPEGLTLVTDLVGRPAVLVVYDAPSPPRRLDDNGVLADVFQLPNDPTESLLSQQGVPMPAPSGIRTAIVSYRGLANALSQPTAPPPSTGEEAVPVPLASALLVAQQAAREAEPDPARRAELLATFAEALRELELDDQATAPDLLSSPRNRVAALVQSFLASGRAPGAAATPAPAGGEELQFAPNDLGGWFFSLFSWIRGIRRHPPARPASFQADSLSESARIFLVGDWGTGLYGAPIIAKTIQNDPRPFTLLMHLGDVYYSGTEKEVRERFLKIWPFRPDATNRALNSNHEMYAGGWGYFDHTLPRFEQASSYFAYQNANWLLIGLDTGYREHDLDDEQVAWLNQVIAGAGNRKIVLFSHHQLYSRLESQGPKLALKLNHLLESRRITAWYWGHEHRCAIYDPHETYGFSGRCLGHGGIPSKRKDVSDFPVKQTVGDILWRRFEARNLVPGGLMLDGPNRDIPGYENTYGPHGYAVLELNGDKLTEILCSTHGDELLRNEIR